MESNEKLADRVCRLCLKYNTENMLPLFENGNLSYYGQAILPFAKVDLVEDSDLPHSMCVQCLVLLQHCISFKFMCEASDRKLKRVKNFIKSGSNISYIKKEALRKRYNNKKRENRSSNDNLFQNSNTSSQSLKEDPDNALNDVDISAIDDISDLSSDDDKGDNDDEDVVKNKKRKFSRYVVRKDKDGRRICPICNKTLGNISSFYVHMQRHEYGKRFICEQCGKNFSTLVGLHGHLLSIHGIGKGIPCPHCPYKAPRSFDLKEHIRIHTGERPFTCEKCGLTFRRREIYKQHLLKYTEKTVKCERCPKMFYKRGDMMAHFNSAHERQFMYVCSECGNLYAKNTTVRRHLMEKHGIPREKQKKIVRIKTAGQTKPL